MSVDVSQPPPLKRLREYTPLSTASSVRGSKCGELFVSKNADKWTFCCSHCQKVTNDIGVFICHIRLDHLNGLPTIEQEQQPPPATPLLQTPSVMLPAAQVSETPFSQENINLPSSLVIQSVKTCSAQSEIFNEEEIISETNRPSIKSENISEVSNVIDISSMSNDNTDTFAANQNLTAPSNDKQFTPCTEFAEAQQQNNAFEYFIVNEVDDHMINEDSELNEGEQGPAQINSNKCHVCYRGFKTKKKMLKHVQRVHGPEREHQRLLLSDMRVDEDVEDEFISVTDNPNDTENSLETYIISDSDEADTTSKTRCTSELAKQKNPTKLYKCKYCDKVAKSKSGLGKHVGILHSDKCDIYKYNCTMCNRGFHTHSGLILHIRTSHEGLQFKCPLCPVKRFRESVFLTHLMTHESDTCFPCPVCGQLFASGNERALHWDGHATERPFVCKYCSKRFSKEYMLKHHLKRHNQYGCNFCSKSFVSEKTLNPPYACRKCEMDPDIKRQVELQKLMKNRQVFESDEDEGDERQEILI